MARQIRYAVPVAVPEKLSGHVYGNGSVYGNMDYTGRTVAGLTLAKHDARPSAQTQCVAIELVVANPAEAFVQALRGAVGGCGG